jgi:hypothetical protein
LAEGRSGHFDCLLTLDFSAGIKLLLLQLTLERCFMRAS